ncbi:hypothetical protein RA27_22425 [Ruegeria sp. ANG-R]|uniref:replication initiation protein RepC n=1 Tax=Ruegeria sp. ANG-R TaxID=1577903 RepID=UPI00057E7DD2|nr:replication initiation protein RepC [Ruegeria sp. ANG-R]KIC36099.1 hypothetical protein RA27_22425 [Ruegeria sp. ANG-R]
MNRNIQAFQAAYSRARDYEAPVLEDISRDDFFRLIKRVAGHLPYPPGKAALRTLREMFEITRPSDWIKPGVEPICYAAQAEIAKRADCTASRIRAHVAELEVSGLVEKRTMGNGRRSGWQDRGIFFTPALERLAEFRQIADLLDEQDKSAARLRGLRSTHKRHLKSAITELTRLLGQNHDRVKQLSDAVANWPRADRMHSMSLQALAMHEADADNLCREALELLRHHEDSDGQPLENERFHKQDTTIKSNIENCNASVQTMPACAQADSSHSDTSPTGDVNCREKNGATSRGVHKSEFIEKLGPDRLYNLASDDMQMHLDIRKHRNGSLEFHDFEIAAKERLPELGIHNSAWNEAVATMGEDSATICVLVLDANRNRPDVPIVSPGGYLRAMTRRAKAGDLNLIGSLIGLSERKVPKGS